MLQSTGRCGYLEARREQYDRLHDTTRNTCKPARAVTMIDHQGTQLTAAVICTTSTNAAEETAIALAAITNSE